MKRAALAHFTVGFLVAVAPQSMAASDSDLDDRWYVAPSINFTYTDAGDNSRPADEGLGASLAIGRAISKRWNLELRAMGANLNHTNGVDEWKQRKLSVDALYFFNRNRGFAPFAQVGVGYQRTDVRNTQVGSPVVDVGLGFTSKVTDYGAAVRAELRYRTDFYEAEGAQDVSEFNEVVAHLGLMVPLGGRDESDVLGLKRLQQDYDSRWYIGAGVGLTLPDSDRYEGVSDQVPGNVELDPGEMAYIIVGRPVSESWNTELRLYSNRMDFDAPAGQIDQIGASLDMQYYFNRNRIFAPYAVFGLGANRTEIAGNSSANPEFNAGVGALSMLTSGIGVRGDVRYRLDTFDNSDQGRDVVEYGDWQVNLGVVVPLGSQTKVARAPEQPLPPVQTPPPVEPPIYQEPPTVERPVLPPVEPPVFREPPPPAPVDSDGDGVDNRFDSCPDTPAGVEVGPDGCPVDQVVVYFDTNSAVIKSSEAAKLNAASRKLLHRMQSTIVVAGHTDSVGSERSNRALSKKRARAVRRYLVERGVRTANIHVKGYGESRPVADNRTRSGRAKNRRVEVNEEN